MNIETEKAELLDWIINLNDPNVIKEFIKLKEKQQRASSKIAKSRHFGCGKGIFTYVAKDFNEPLPDFKEYMS
jgi:hypothetical protein